MINGSQNKSYYYNSEFIGSSCQQNEEKSRLTCSATVGTETNPPVLGGFVTWKLPSDEHSTIGKPIFSLNAKIRN